MDVSATHDDGNSPDKDTASQNIVCKIWGTESPVSDNGPSSQQPSSNYIMAYATYGLLHTIKPELDWLRGLWNIQERNSEIQRWTNWGQDRSFPDAILSTTTSSSPSELLPGCRLRTRLDQAWNVKLKPHCWVRKRSTTRDLNNIHLLKQMESMCAILEEKKPCCLLHCPDVGSSLI